jgi:hypothetical protein
LEWALRSVMQPPANMHQLCTSGSNESRCKKLSLNFGLANRCSNAKITYFDSLRTNNSYRYVWINMEGGLHYFSVVKVVSTKEMFPSPVTVPIPI